MATKVTTQPEPNINNVVLLDIPVQKAKFEEDVTWERNDNDDVHWASVIVTMLEDYSYTHPSGDCTVTIKKDSKFKFLCSTYDDDFYVDEACLVNGGAWECMGKKNPHVPVEVDLNTDELGRAEMMHTLVTKGLDVLLMHAVNYDGTEGTFMSLEQSKIHYQGYGIVYDTPMSAERVDEVSSAWEKRYNYR